DTFRYRVSGSHQETEGYDRQNNGENDAYRSNNASALVSWKISDAVETELAYLVNTGESEFDDLFGGNPRFTKFRVETLSNKTTVNVTDNLKFTSTLARSTDLSDSRSDISGTGFGALKTRRDTMGLQVDYTLGEYQVITLGGENYNERVDQDTRSVESNTIIGLVDGEFPVSSRENRAFFGQYQLNFEGLELIAGWRKDDNEVFETANTRNVSLGYNFGENYKVLYSYSTGFKAPSFNQLYFPGFGNPDIQAESSRSNELTFKGNWDNLDLEVTFFRTTFENLIETAFVGCGPSAPFCFLPVNLGEARVKGFDIVASTEIAGYQLSSSYTWLDPDNQSAADDEPLRRRARRSLKLSADKAFGDFNIGLALNAQSETFDTTELPGYGVVDLHMGYKVSKNLDLGLKVSNLLDKDYQTIVTYDEDGVNAVLSATYRL
ncbi:MAG: TonB-dependent receptor, partial [Pseudomonadales bacterium]|nr:TonB-dependent receptor [Pseudomonadales bacterium]